MSRPVLSTATRRYHRIAKACAGLGIAGSATYCYVWYRLSRPKDPSPSAYGLATIASSYPITPHHRSLTVNVPHSTAQHLSNTLVPYHFNVKNPYLTVARSYTPVHIIDHPDPSFQFLIKQYKVGETSNWMHRQLPGAIIEINGPLQYWYIPPPPSTQSNATLTMIAGGTGVTPFIQVLDAALNNPTSPSSANAAQWSQFKLIYFLRSEDEVLDRAWLDQLAAMFPHRFSVHYFTRGRQDISKQVLQQCLPAPGNGLVVVCGPDGFVNAVAGRRGEILMTQGPLGGILDQLGYSANEVHKME